MKRIIKRLTILTVALLVLSSAELLAQDNSKLERIAVKRLEKWSCPVKSWGPESMFKPDSLTVTGNTVNVFFPVVLSYMPIRESTNNQLKESLKVSLGRRFKKLDVIAYTNGYATDRLIPNIYRSAIETDDTRIIKTRAQKPSLVMRVDAWHPAVGLENEYIALWHSHGLYFDQSLDRWEWQRAKIFGTVEDLSVMGYVLPYLTPMLERAGATVMLPRERDTQKHEVIVDNDRSTGNSEFVLQLANEDVATGLGFRMTDTIFQNINPFVQGTSLKVKNDTAVYIPEIPATGNYAVYISYPASETNTHSALYTVTHAGGSTRFVIDQTIGGGTWIYLGTFLFREGKERQCSSVTAISTDGRDLALDAVRFGGGMGNIARRPSEGFVSNQWSLNPGNPDTAKDDESVRREYTWKISGKPRYLEGARYWLQYAGMPDSVVYSQNKFKNDYNDDYMSRGEWVNYLMGGENGPMGRKDMKGLGIPVDISLAFHTDAGITPDTSIVGTLGIYSTAAGEGLFPDGASRLASRDLTDIIQTQITEDISSSYNIKWSRRGLWDKSYSEARKPNAPAMLLELLSHQNLADQQYGLDPRFRFCVSRAVYKGMLKFLAYNEGRPYVVAPLPVDHFAIVLSGEKKVKLSWEPVSDPLEPTAKSDRYKVYKRTGDGGFDNGMIVEGNSVELNIDSYNVIYSFKITALNDGGESFDSEILSVGLVDTNATPVLVVNGFDRISGPAWFDKGGMAGVAWWNDKGVADHYDIVSVGKQYDFDRYSQWLDDDNPGWGASYSDAEGSVIPGNSFDYPYIHGKALMNAGRSFVSVSDEVFCQPSFATSSYGGIDIILGEEKTTPSIASMRNHEFSIYTPLFMQKLVSVIDDGTSLFISGSYVGTEIVSASDTTVMKFAAGYLHIKPRTDHAVNSGNVYSTDYSFPVFNDKLTFTMGDDGEVYGAESPDAIEPADKRAVVAFRYSENNTSAGVMYKGESNILVLGFPFETITSENDRNQLMKQVSDFFNNK